MDDAGSGSCPVRALALVMLTFELVGGSVKTFANIENC
jgi:hypothetical protein